MYVTQLRKEFKNPVDGWSKYKDDVFWHDGPPADFVLDEIDQTLTSDAKAQTIFNEYQGNKKRVDYAAFEFLRPLVYNVIKDRLLNTETSFPVELFTYALLLCWIKVRQAGLAAGEKF